MIRVNLIQQRRAAAPAQSSQKWLLVALALVLLEVVGVVLFHQSKTKEFDEAKAKNAQLQSKINENKNLVANHEEIKQKLAVCKQRNDAIDKLKSGRQGPTAVLLELSKLLTSGKGPTSDPDRLAQIRRNNPLAVYAPGWDPRRLWIREYKEQDRQVTLQGLARDGTDVSEFAQRLKLSTYFYDVVLLPGKQEDDKSGVQLVSFAVSVKVRY